MGEKELTELFLWQVARKVSAVGIISVVGVEFEVDGFLKGKKVEVRYNPFNLGWVNIYYKEQFIGKAKPATLSRWNTTARIQTKPEDQQQPKPTGIKPLNTIAEKHHQQKKQTAGTLVGRRAAVAARPAAITLPALIKLIAEARGKKPEAMHPKELDTCKRFLQQHPDLTTECTAVAMAKAVLCLGKDQHITRYLDTIKNTYLKRKENRA